MIWCFEKLQTDSIPGVFDFYSFANSCIFSFFDCFDWKNDDQIFRNVRLRANRRNNVGSCCVRLIVAKSLTGFKLCATNPNNTQQHANRVCMQTDTTCNIQQCCVRLHGASLRSRRLEVVGERENGCARGRHARGEGAPALPSRVSFSRARFFLCPLLPSARYAG